MRRSLRPVWSFTSVRSVVSLTAANCSPNTSYEEGQVAERNIAVDQSDRLSTHHERFAGRNELMGHLPCIAALHPPSHLGEHEIRAHVEVSVDLARHAHVANNVAGARRRILRESETAGQPPPALVQA